MVDGDMNRRQGAPPTDMHRPMAKVEKERTAMNNYYSRTLNNPHMGNTVYDQSPGTTPTSAVMHQNFMVPNVPAKNIGSVPGGIPHHNMYSMVPPGVSSAAMGGGVMDHPANAGMVKRRPPVGMGLGQIGVNAVSPGVGPGQQQPQQQRNSSKSSKMDEMIKKIPKVLRDHYAVNIDQPLGKGSFGAIFITTHMPTGQRYAVKFENIPTDNNKPVLFYDQQFLYYLTITNKCSYVPKFIDYSTTNYFHFLIMEMCGPSVIDLLKAAPKGCFSTQCTTLLGLGMMTALYAVHELKIIHRDIKPDNFVLGTENDCTKILLIDFGLSKQYQTLGRHIKIRSNKDLTGTARYVSINTHNGFEQSRRDDLEALSYVLTYLYKGGKLPWVGIQVTDRQLHFKKICKIKETIDLNVLCEDCPEEMIPFISYCRGLPFTLDPNYQYLFDLLIQISNRLNFSVDEKRFDWDYEPAFQRKLYRELDRINYFNRSSANHHQLEYNNGWH